LVRTKSRVISQLFPAVVHGSSPDNCVVILSLVLVVMIHSIPYLCGSIASKPSYLGVRMHNAAYADLGLPYTYVAFGLTDAKAAIEAMRSLGMPGLSIGVPHKLEVMKHLDAIDPVAREIGQSTRW